jgi:hypothetical protein
MYEEAKTTDVKKTIVLLLYVITSITFHIRNNDFILILDNLKYIKESPI